MEGSVLPHNEGPCGCPLEVRYRRALESIAKTNPSAEDAIRIAKCALGEPSPCYCGGDARMKVHSPSGCGLTEVTARGTGGMPPWTFDTEVDGGY